MVKSEDKLSLLLNQYSFIYMSSHLTLIGDASPREFVIIDDILEALQASMKPQKQIAIFVFFGNLFYIDQSS